MTTPPFLDIGRHVRVDRDPVRRPSLTGVTALLQEQRGVTQIDYPCAEGIVAIELGWRLTRADRLEVARVVPTADHSAAVIAGVIGDTFLCDVTYCTRMQVIDDSDETEVRRAT